jgi:hypothetical protein
MAFPKEEIPPFSSFVCVVRFIFFFFLMKIYTTALLSTLASAVLAFENTVPCVMWSPKE